MSSRGTVVYGVTKGLARILRPLVGKSPHPLLRTKVFLEQISNNKLQEYECMSSHDVKALLTSIPIEPAVNIIKEKLEKDEELLK